MCLRECLCFWLCTGYKHNMLCSEGGTRDRSVLAFHISTLILWYCVAFHPQVEAVVMVSLILYVTLSIRI